MNIEDLKFLIYCDDACSKVHMVYDISYYWMHCKSSSSRCRHFRSCSEYMGFIKVFK